MTTETMTIHKALAELKTLDSRIGNACSATFATVNKHSNEKIEGVTISEYKNRIRDNYNKVTDLINRRIALKKAVVMSNAVTKVMVNNVEYTVAEAIEMKNHGMEFKKHLLAVLTAQRGQANLELIRNSAEALERKAEQFILSTIQAQPKDLKMGVDSEAMKALRKDYIANNTYDFLDPLNIDKIIEDLSNEINEFNIEVDAALSVSNAITEINIEY